MKWRPSSRVTLLKSGFIEPCIPTAANKAPAGGDWLYELKHDGYRLMVRRDGDRVRIYSRRGADFTPASRASSMPFASSRSSPSCSTAKASVYDQAGMPSFDLIHSKQYDGEASLIAFDLLEVDGEDVRRKDLLARKLRLKMSVARLKSGTEYNDHLQGDGAQIFAHACGLGHEGIVAKRSDLGYESGRSKRWLKIKNPDSAAMQRVRDETF
jgi:bifunctional non-homologous end joining protein LigD